MRNSEALKPGMRVKIVRWAINNPDRYAEEDRKQLVGRTGTVIENGIYVSVKLDEDPALLPSAVLCVLSELELCDEDSDASRTA